MRVVADTNVLISALMFSGLPGRFLDMARAGVFRLVTSPALLDELDEKLRGKFKVPTDDADAIRARLELMADLVIPDLTLRVVLDDPDDDRVLECAVAGRADCVVSGDRHLLSLSSYQGIAISTVRNFMESAKI